MEKTFALSFLTLAALGCGAEGSRSTADPSTPITKVYVAVEDGGMIAVLDGRDLRSIANIGVGDYMPHNVQVAPDGKSVWAALVARDPGGHGGGGHGTGESMQDQVVVVDPSTDSIVARVDIGAGAHPAHVVVTPDSRTVLVTGNEANEVIRIDAASRKVLDRIPLGHASGVHGARVSVDGTTLWAAQIEGKCAARVDLATSTAEHVGLEGQAVQVAVSPDGRWIFASQYDTKSVARIDASTRAVSYAALPADSQGPVQLYPTPDGRSILVADQGVLAGRPASNKLYVLDGEAMVVTGSVDVGLGAHGVVASGDRAFVTSIEDDTVTAVDLATKKVVAQGKPGKKPNGISVWTKAGGTP